MRINQILYSIFLFLFAIQVHAKKEHKEGEFNFGEVLMHHILDTHDWHITDIPAGDKTIPVAIHLPYIVYDSEQGLMFFSLHGHTYEEKKEEVAKMGLDIDHYGHIKAPEGSNKTVLDISITKTVLQIIIVGILMLLTFGFLSKKYKQNRTSAPKGIQNLFEVFIDFIRTDIVEQYFPGKSAKWGPLFLTIFFFIYFSNLVGLTPFGFNITGNISVTAALATMSFVLIQVNGSKDYWAHIFWFPGVPVPLKLLLMVIELIGIFAKAFALAVRLFANIVGGHIMLISLIGLMFIMYALSGYAETTGAFAMMPISVLFGLIIFTLEFLIVSPIQAYIFTLLTAVFISSAMETHDDHH